MIILDRKIFGPKPIADWFYDTFELNIDRDYESSLDGEGNEKILNLLDCLFKTFEKYQLFLINKIEIIGFLPSDKNKENRIKTSIPVKPISSYQNIQELIKNNLKEPLNFRNISFLGKTLVYKGNNNTEYYDDIFYFETGISIISVRTYCDVWLPYDLNGKIQQEIYKLNAPIRRSV